MIMICSDFIFSFPILYVIISFFNKLLTLVILFSTAVRAVVVAKLVILGTLNSNHNYFSIKSSISSKINNIRYFICNIFYPSVIYICFNMIFTTSFSLLKSTGTGNLSTSNLSNVSS